MAGTSDALLRDEGWARSADLPPPGGPKGCGLVEQAINGWGARKAPIRAVVLERLGPVVWHDDPAKAMAVLEELRKPRSCGVDRPDGRLRGPDAELLDLWCALVGARTIPNDPLEPGRNLLPTPLLYPELEFLDRLKQYRDAPGR